MIPCAKCQPQLHNESKLVLCPSCFSGWKKTLSLEEYLEKPYKPDPVKYPPGHSTVVDEWVL